MRESCTSGSARAASSNGGPYRNTNIALAQFEFSEPSMKSIVSAIEDAAEPMKLLEETVRERARSFDATMRDAARGGKKAA